MSSGSYKNIIYSLCIYKSYLFDMYKQDGALNNLHRYAIKPTQPT